MKFAVDFEGSYKMGVWLAIEPLHDHDVFFLLPRELHRISFSILIFTCLEFLGLLSAGRGIQSQTSIEGIRRRVQDED